MGLKPCPFCGSENISITAPSNHGGWDGPPSYIIQCKNCFAEIDLQSSCKKGTLIKWNRRYEPPNSPLTLDELREMDGEPVWCEDYQLWGIVKVESKGQWANQPFLCGVYHSDGIATNFEHDIEKRGLTLYRRRPEDISKKEEKHG